MLVERTGLWLPSRSLREVLRCTGAATLLLIATFVTHRAIPQTLDPARTGACHRAVAQVSLAP